MNNKPTYKELENQITELKKQNEILRLNTSIQIEDITTRKKAEKALKKSEEKYRRLSENAQDMIYRMSLPDGKYEYISPASAIICEYNPKEIYNTPLFLSKIIHPDFSDYFKTAWSKLIKGEMSPTYEYKIITKTGKEKWLHERNVLIKDKLNNPIAMEGIVTDITARKEAEDKLRESVSNTNSLINNRNELIWSIDNNYNFIIFNNFFKERYFAAYKTELKKGLNVLSVLTPELSAFWKPEYDKVFLGEKNVFEFSAQVNNVQIWYEVTLNPIILDDKVTGLSAISIDITEHKKAEQALKENEKSLNTIIENIPFAVFAHNLDGEFIIVNNFSSKYTGYSKQELVKMTVADIDKESLSRNDREEIWLQLNQFGEKQIISNHYKKDGSTYPVEITITSITLKNKPILLAIVQDISKRQKAEQALKESESKLRESNNTKDKFFSIMSHDLKSPFNAILGLSDILLENHNKYDEAKREKIIKLINKSANSAFKLVENLLTWSKTQSGHIKYLPEELHVIIVLVKIIQQLQTQADKKYISVSDLISENDIIFADEDMVATVLRNLISNAIKFTNNNGKIDITSKKQTDSNFLEISVADTGVGIPKDKIDDLFCIDKDISTKGTENETGTGLGLILCKEFVEKLGGNIWVESELGKGSNLKYT